MAQPRGGRKLRCIVFLETHFEQGGLDKKGFEMLYRMIQMSSAIGSEVHVIHQSKILCASSLTKMEWYCKCILQGCEAFHANMQQASVNAKGPPRGLSTDSVSRRTSQAELTQWREQLKTLHDPNGNDARLFQLILEHFDRNAYLRLYRLSTRKPAYGLEMLVDRTTEVYEALHGLCQIALKADRRVNTLRELIRKSEKGAEANAAQSSLEAIDEILQPNVYMEPLRRAETQPPSSLSKSFSAVQEEMSLRRHARAATVSEADYTICTTSMSAAQLSDQGAANGARRRTPHAPRIFTGSLSQLESDVRKIQLHKIKTPELPDGSSGHVDVKIRDFGATPLISPSGSFTTMASLQRREAIVSRDTELQDRIIKGEVVTSRRPSKSRAQTIDNSFDLEAWLKQDSCKVQSPEKKRLGVSDGGLLHRQKSL